MELSFSFCFASLLIFIAQTAYVVSVEFNDVVYAKTGSALTLTCAAGVELNGNESVTWMKGDIGSSVPVSSLNDSRISTNSNSLSITGYRHSEHGGVYYCVTESPSNHYQLSHPINIHHARILANNPSVEAVTELVSVIINNTAGFVCEVPLSWPPADIYWERDGTRLDIENDSRFHLLPSGNLYIVAATERDEALYRCSATNPITMATRHSKVSYQFTVSAPPVNNTLSTFSILPVDTVAIAGSSVTLECLGHAHPSPEFEWVIHHSGHFPRGYDILATGSLRFDPVTSEDAHMYRCVLRNSVGSVYSQMSLQVKEPPLFSSTPEPHLQLPVDGTVAANNTPITCTVSGSAPLEALLVHGGQVIKRGSLAEDSGERREVVLTHSVDEEGVYQCFAKNDYGSQQWTTLVTLAPSLQTSTESGSSVSTSSVEEITSAEPFTERPSNESAQTRGMSTTMSEEALATTETTQAPFFVNSTDGEPTTNQQKEPTTTISEEEPTSGQGEPTTSGGSDTPTETALTTPPLPMLDVMTNGDSFSVLHGSSLLLECHVTGGGAGTLLSWYFNGVKLPDVGVASSSDQDGSVRLSSKLNFDLVDMSHAGQYLCEAHSPLHSLTVTAPIQVNVESPLLPPLNLTLVGNGQNSGRLAIMWRPNPLNEGRLSGYKLNWDHSSRVVQSAADSVPSSNMEFTTDPIDLSVAYTVLVWAYNGRGDGLPAKAKWSPQTIVPTTTEASTECIAMDISSTQVLLEWPEQIGGSGDTVDIIATCQASQTSSVIAVSTAKNYHTLHHLLPSCRYHFRVGVASCYVDTPPGNVDLSARVYRHDNSSIQLDWFLPRELQAVANELVIEVKVGGAWVPIQPGHVPHIPANLSTEHRIQFRLRLGNWEGHSLIIIPPQTTPTSSTPTTFTMETEPMAEGMNFDLNELGLIYGFIFGLLILTCASVVFTILVLKYVQMNRREDDKVTNHREKHMEEFHRLSLKRSSTNSIKKDPTFHQPKEV